MFRIVKDLLVLVALGLAGCASEPTCELRGVVIGDIKVGYEQGQDPSDQASEKVRNFFIDSLCQRGALIVKPEPEFKLYARWNNATSDIRVVVTRNNPEDQIVNLTYRWWKGSKSYALRDAAAQATRDFCLALKPVAKPSSQ